MARLLVHVEGETEETFVNEILKPHLWRFGFAPLGMPLLTLVMGSGTAVPLVSLLAITLYAVNLAPYRQSLHLGELKRRALAASWGVPVGLW